MRGSRKLAAAVAVAVVVLFVSVPALGATGWSGPTLISNSSPPTAISCPSASFCAAVGTAGFVYTFNGTTWGTPTQPDPNGNSLSAVSCPSASFCVAVDNLGGAITFNGSTWSAPTRADTTGNGLNAVSCTSSSFCVAGDGGGNGFVFNGSAWSGPFTINTTSNQESIGGISCVSPSFCVAAGQAGTIETSTDGGRTWSSPATQVGSNDLRAVSCASQTFCVAVDTGGNAYTFNGSAWSGANPIDTADGTIDGGALDAVSCPSATFCAAIDGLESVLTFNGSAWTAPARLEPGTVSHSSVSCPSAGVCEAVDGAGNAFSYGAPITPGPTPTPAPAPLPAPVLGKSVNASVISGVVFVRTGGAKAGDVAAGPAAAPGSGFVRLITPRQLPVGAEIDALGGALKLVTATSRKHTSQTGTFRGAVFRVTQARSGASKGLATLSLVEGAFRGAPTYAACSAKGKSLDVATAAAGHRVLQLLHASAHGKFRTTGRYSAATVRGTSWSISDRCDGTFTHVVTHTVAVTDFVRHVTVVLHAGQSYLARAPVHRSG
ncbi:MAG: hypothetical protein JO027_19190 [Solirubrobacterales bacterium]|nr:hypothetical protein [Solirubrobacterales bacterium]